jgi:holo-[acyl-carrier protein] synthase
MLIGTDLCDPKRIEKIYLKFGAKFLKRILSIEEIDQINSTDSNLSFFQRVAGRYAAKEAIAKAFGTGIGKQLSFQDIEILRDKISGAPLVKSSEKLAVLTKQKGLSTIKVSISHEKLMAIAMVLVY